MSPHHISLASQEKRPLPAGFTAAPGGQKKRSADRPASPSPSALPDSAGGPIARLQDLPPDTHRAVFACMPERDAMRYVRALPAPLSGLSHAVVLGSRIHQARSLPELQACADTLGAVDTDFRERPIRQLQQRLAGRTLPLPAHGAQPLTVLLRTCEAASADLAGTSAGLLERQRQAIGWAIAVRNAGDTRALLQLLQQARRLPPAEQSRALVDALQAAGRLLPAQGLEQVAVAVAGMAGALPPHVAAPALRSAFRLCEAVVYGAGLPPWGEAGRALTEAVIVLPGEVFQRAMPADDVRFAPLAAFAMRTRGAVEAAVFFDALLAGMPSEAGSRGVALAQLAGLLPELPTLGLLERTRSIVRHIRQLGGTMARREDMIEKLVLDTVPRLHATDRPVGAALIQSLRDEAAPTATLPATAP